MTGVEGRKMGPVLQYKGKSGAVAQKVLVCSLQFELIHRDEEVQSVWRTIPESVRLDASRGESTQNGFVWAKTLVTYIGITRLMVPGG